MRGDNEAGEGDPGRGSASRDGEGRQRSEEVPGRGSPARQRGGWSVEAGRAVGTEAGRCPERRCPGRRSSAGARGLAARTPTSEFAKGAGRSRDDRRVAARGGRAPPVPDDRASARRWARSIPKLLAAPRPEASGGLSPIPAARRAPSPTPGPPLPRGLPSRSGPGCQCPRLAATDRTCGPESHLPSNGDIQRGKAPSLAAVPLRRRRRRRRNPRTCARAPPRPTPHP